MELKFRVWHKERKKYYEVLTINFLEKSVYIPTWINRVKKVFFDEVIIEQHTGFKDKNGKEIYAGDIVNFKAFTRNKLECGVIAYHNGTVYISNFSGYSDEYIAGTFDLEVIGNIHENKELLK